jgi:hypothetical protein
MRAAMVCFERALNTFVKKRVELHFPEVDPAKVARLKEQAARKATQADLAQLERELQNYKALKNKSEWTGQCLKMIMTRKKQMAKKLRDTQKVADADKKNPLVKRHILECRYKKRTFDQDGEWVKWESGDV